MKSWHTRQERKVIQNRGGTPLVKSGYDGMLRGRPVEVRSVREDDRYRIQQNTHETLVRERGSYIFCDSGRTKTVPAKEVSQIMGRGNWYKDRKYPHRFVKKEDIF